MSDPEWVHAFIDESGQRSSRSERSSRFFVMSAVVIRDAGLQPSSDLLAELRCDLGRRRQDVLHWQNLKQHGQRLHVSKTLGEQPSLLFSSVIVDKRALPGSMNDDRAYMYTFRFLLERLSWIARDHQGALRLKYTLAHVVRFKLSTLREYESRLRGSPDCQIDWASLDPHGGRLDQPQTLEHLQLADAVASATAAAFEPDRFGNTEPRYLQLLAPRLYRRGSGPKRLTSYGLKFHPDASRSAYPWVADL